MSQGLRVLTPPATLAVSIFQAFEHLRIDPQDGDVDDPLVTAALLGAIQQAQDYTGRAFITTEFTLTLDQFPGEIELPKNPAIEILEIRYTDTAGAVQILADTEYRLVPSFEPAILAPAYGKSWPSTQCIPGAVAIDFSAGYGLAQESVPAPIKQAILLYTEALYERDQRTIDLLTNSAQSLLNPYRVWR